MSQSKILTYIPFGKLFENMPDHINFTLSKNGEDFLDNNFTKCSEELSENYMHYKDGTPETVNAWAKEFGLDLNLSGDYAIATILHIAMTWEKPANETEIYYNDVTYEAGWHNEALRTNVHELYNIPVEDEFVGFFVSTKEFPLDELNNKIFEYQEINLSLPIVKLKIEEDLSKHFLGSSAIINEKPYYCSGAKSLTELDITLKGAEVKQAAALVLEFTSAAPFLKDSIIIDKPFYVYVKVKDSLIFAAYIDLDSWVIK